MSGKPSKLTRLRANAKESPEAFARRLRPTRVGFVADMIREATFDPDRTPPALEREWKLTDSDVAQIVKQARSRVRRELAATPPTQGTGEDTP